MGALIGAKGTEITGISRYKDPVKPSDVVKHCMRNRSTIEVPEVWEQLNNPDYTRVEFDSYVHQA